MRASRERSPSMSTPAVIDSPSIYISQQRENDGARDPRPLPSYPVQADAVFARLDPSHVASLQRDWTFYIWDEPTSTVRWMTAFDTAESDVDAFLADVAAVAGVVSV